MEDVVRGMGETMGMGESDPTKMLTEEHNKVKDLFGEFERASDMEKRGKVFADIVKNLNAHAGIEEAIFYPVAQQIIGDPQMIQQSLKDHMQMKEHMSHIAMLMGNEEVSMMQSRSSMGTGSMGQRIGISGTYMEHYQMLKDGVMKHVQMEEGQMFPMVKQAIPEDQLGKIARMMFEKKHQLM